MSESPAPLDDAERKTLILLDGNGLLYRAFFSMRALTNSAGQPTNALFGLTNMLLTLLEREKPDLIFCAWDAPVKTFRHDRYAEYKGTRQETPSELTAQGPLARELVAAFGVPAIEAPGFEADDILGTLAARGKAAGYQVLIVTGDSDALQLVEPGVRVMMTVKGVTDTVVYDEAAVRARYGLEPLQLTDYRALKGDSSDNIPGVPGIGEKTATTLLQAYGTIEELQTRLDEVTPARVQAALAAGVDSMVLSKELAIIQRDIPLPEVVLPDPESLAPWALERERVVAIFDKLEFRTLLKRLPDDKPAPDAAPKPAPRVERNIRVTEDLTGLAAAARASTGGIGIRMDVGEGGTLDAPLYGLALAAGEGEVFYIPLAQPPAGEGMGGLFGEAPPAPPGALPDFVKALIGDASIPKITHDARTEITLLNRLGAELKGLAFDTELAAYLLNAGRRSGFPLHEVASDFAGIALPAPLERKERKGLDETAAAAHSRERATRGADALRAIRAVQEPRLAAEGLTSVLCDLELPIAPILAAMERAGILLDSAVMRRLSDEMTTRIAELEGQIHQLAGGPFQIQSIKQLQEVLFEKLKLPAGKKTKTGYSTDADVLEELAPQYPIVALILQYRELAKLKSTYADAMPALARADGRIHTSLHQTVAATGRLSSSSPNLQNIPIRTPIGRDLRRAFVAPPGRLLLSADYSQIELRILAHMADDAELQAAFESGEDIHKYTAGKVYGVPVERVTGDMRRAAKTVNYAVLYGISDFNLARQLKITMSEARTLKADYFDRFPSVRAWLDGTIEFAREKGYVQTLYGRKRWMPDIHSRVFSFRQASERAATNMPIQGSSADIMKRAMISVWDDLAGADLPATLLLQVHDELLFEVDPAAAGALGERVRACMEGAAALKVTLEVEVKTGATWGDVTPVAA